MTRFRCARSSFRLRNRRTCQIVLLQPCRVPPPFLEITDSVRPEWDDFLAEVERNHEATASLGLVRELSQNAGQSIRVLGSRRIVMVFDTAQDDAGLLRTVDVSEQPIQTTRLEAVTQHHGRVIEATLLTRPTDPHP